MLRDFQITDFNPLRSIKDNNFKLVFNTAANTACLAQLEPLFFFTTPWASLLAFQIHIHMDKF